MDKIFQEWRNKDIHKGETFITDGAIDQKKWENSEFKILFLLKEAYGEEKHLPNLIKRRIKDNKLTSRTFKPMAQWAYGIQKVYDTNKIFDFLKEDMRINDALMSSAIINIKKSKGHKSSNKANLSKYVDEDWHLIEKQINILKPNIIICGNTFSLIKDKLEKKNKISERIYKNKEFIYVDFWHPSNRASKLMNYYALCALIYKWKNS